MNIGKKVVTPAIVFIVIIAVFALPVCVKGAGTETQLYFNSIGESFTPIIYGSNVVWADSRNGNSDIYLYNLVTGSETQITTDPNDQINPKIYQDRIVWEDYRNSPNSRIYLYPLASGSEVQVSGGASRQRNPAIYGIHIVWQDDRDPAGPVPNPDHNWSIFINGTTPGSEYNLTPLAPGFNQESPAIYGDLVVWMDRRNGGPAYNIYLYNLTSRQETRVTTDPNSQIFPAIYGNRIVWRDGRTPFAEIFINGSAPGLESSLTPGSLVPAQYPMIYGSKVVWEQTNLTTGGKDIFMNDTGVSGSSIPVALDAAVSADTKPQLFIDPAYGDRIVWQDDRPGWNSLSLFTSKPGTPAACPVADFTSDFSGGGAPATVHFTDLTPPLVTHRFWDFGDGSSAMDPTPPVHTYTANNPYPVTLIVSNPWCRNATMISDYIVVGKPLADFTASPISEIVPATIHFTDTSNGNPDTWSWDFGDGGTSAEQNPTYVYTVPGTYTVSLTASNSYGSNISTKAGYITALKGANYFANTTIDGISLSSCSAGSQIISVDTSVVTASLTPNSSVLEIQPPQDRGFDKVTVYALDGTGFTSTGTILSGHVTGVLLQTNEIVPTGFSSGTGPVSVSYSTYLPSYPCSATLNTQVWEGVLPADSTLFEKIAIGSSFAYWLGTPYTTRVTKVNLPATGTTAKLQMSVNAAWVASNGGRSQIFIERIADNRLVGEVLPTRYLSHDPVKNLDYFEADSPHGLSTFGLSALSGSGNPLQLITLTLASHIDPPSPQTNPSSDSDISPAVTGTVKTPTPTPSPSPKVTATQTLVPADPGKSAKVYTNDQSVVTQATSLQSTDGLATISISEGLVAKDATGKPLTEITIKALPLGSLPPVPSGSMFTFAGMAYEIGPDGATFSQPIQLSLSLPQAQWGLDYSVKSFDTKSGTWQDLPTSFNPSTGTVTVEVLHLCSFALFGQPRSSPSPVITAAATPLPVPAAAPANAPPPATSVNIFMSLITWVTGIVTNNVIPIIAVIIIGISGYLVTLGRFPGSGQ